MHILFLHTLSVGFIFLVNGENVDLLYQVSSGRLFFELLYCMYNVCVCLIQLYCMYDVCVCLIQLYFVRFLFFQHFCTPWYSLEETCMTSVQFCLLMIVTLNDCSCILFFLIFQFRVNCTCYFLFFDLKQKFIIYINMKEI